MIEAENAPAGAQYLEVSGEAMLAYPEWTAGKSVAYLDFQIKPVADASKEPCTTIDADGARLAFLKEGASGVIYACDGADAGLPLGEGRALDGHGRAADWIRVTLRLDYLAGVYDVYVDGVPAVVNLRLDPQERPRRPARFTLHAGEAGDVGLDEFRLTATNPLYDDRDDDGLPDAYEAAAALNPNSNDRVAGETGMARVKEFLAGFQQGADSTHGPAQPGGRVIYVSPETGDDSFDGRQCYRVAGSGPKASVKAAARMAKAGDTVVVMEGSYHEGTYNLTDDHIQYRFTGHVDLL